MNRYNKGPTLGGPSKATASTLCQKCLTRDIYECKANAQERPYVSRPSRTQQLLDPRLVPKLTSDIPQDLLRKKGVADEQLAKLALERGRKRELQSEDPESRVASKRRRSASASSASVSTISTNLSRSPSPEQAFRERDSPKPKSTSFSKSLPLYDRGPHEPRRASASRSPPLRRELTDSEKKRRRDSVSSIDSYISEGRCSNRQGSRDRASSRSTRRRIRQQSPSKRGRRSVSRSPHRDRRRLSRDRQRASSPDQRDFNNSGPTQRNGRRDNRGPYRERSLSPFSKRLALTQAMNVSR